MPIVGLTDKDYSDKNITETWRKILELIHKKSFKTLLEQQVLCNRISYAPLYKCIGLYINEKHQQRFKCDEYLLYEAIDTVLGNDFYISMRFVKPELLKTELFFLEVCRYGTKKNQVETNNIKVQERQTKNEDAYKIRDSSNTNLNNARTWSNEQEETIRVWNNLRFRSVSEIAIAEELEKRNIFFAPNPACRVGGIKDIQEHRENLEPDFIISYNGKWAFIEVDSTTYHPDFYKKDNFRDILFEINTKARVYRFHRNDILNKGASWCIETVLKLMS